MLKPPLFCSICSSPCALPRLPLPLPLPSATLSPQSAKRAEGFDGYNSEDWLRAWYCLRVSTGVVEPTPFMFNSIEPSSFPLDNPPQSTSSRPEDQSEGKRNKPVEPPRRIIPIHEYCLSLIGRTIQKSQFSNATTHEESVLWKWSIPNWTGYGPWSLHNLTKNEIGKAFIVPIVPKDDRSQGVGKVMMSPGYWGGMVDQRDRFSRLGNHLTEDDLISPITVNSPIPRTRTSIHAISLEKRPRQHSKLLEMPEPILIRIIQFILDDPELPCLSSSSRSSSSSSLSSSLSSVQKGARFTLSQPLNPNSVQSFNSFLQTSSQLRSNLELPTQLWVVLISNSVRSFRNELVGRWRANPTGCGGALKLFEALQRDFDEPVESAIEGVLDRKRGRHALRDDDVDFEEKECGVVGVENRLNGQEEEGYDIKDVWLWWNYNKSWKSRRRVWRCIVHGTATARDTDWW